jgi:hypothetical protein
MKKRKDIPQIFRQLRVPASSKLDERVHGEIANAVTPAATAPAGSQRSLRQMFALFLKKQATRYTLATTVGIAVLAVLAFIHSTSSAWAMEQAIEAIKKYKALQITGSVARGGKTVPLDVWARADVTGNLVEAGLAKWGDFTVWTRDNKTYTYDQTHHAVFVELGITFGLNPWPGPKLLTVLTTMKDYRTFEGDDPATGQKRVIVTCGIERTGRSKLGPLALVPSWFRYQDGMVRKVWMVVQFRETDQGTSCVVYGDHGYALNVKERRPIGQFGVS